MIIMLPVEFTFAAEITVHLSKLMTDLKAGIKSQVFRVIGF